MYTIFFLPIVHADISFCRAIQVSTFGTRIVHFGRVVFLLYLSFNEMNMFVSDQKK